MSKYRKHSNPEYIKAMRELRKSNASGVHADGRYRRKRTRSASTDAEVEEQLNWGDYEETQYGSLPDNRFLSE